MTNEDLEHIFRFQLHPVKPEEREENLYYMMVDGSDSKIIERFNYNEGFDKLLPLLDNFIFEGYRDKMPIFIKPEIIIPM
jgi:hypothetical protein